MRASRACTVALSLLVAGGIGCEESESSEGTTEMPTGATCPEGSTLTYEGFARPFFDAYCTRCHSASVSGDDRQGAPSDHNFDSEIEIAGLAEHIDERAAAAGDIVNTNMPPSDPRPTEEERRQLGEYLACALEAFEGTTTQ